MMAQQFSTQNIFSPFANQGQNRFGALAGASRLGGRTVAEPLEFGRGGLAEQVPGFDRFGAAFQNRQPTVPQPTTAFSNPTGITAAGFPSVTDPGRLQGGAATEFNPTRITAAGFPSVGTPAPVIPPVVPTTAFSNPTLISAAGFPTNADPNVIQGAATNPLQPSPAPVIPPSIPPFVPPAITQQPVTIPVVPTAPPVGPPAGVMSTGFPPVLAPPVLVPPSRRSPAFGGLSFNRLSPAGRRARQGIFTPGRRTQTFIPGVR